MIRFKYILSIFLLIVFASMCLADETKKKQPVVAEEDDFKKIEVGFLFGSGIPQFDFKNSISDSYSMYWYDESAYWYTEYDITGSFSSAIIGDSEKGFGVGGFFNYFFHKNFGFQFMLERSTHNVTIEASHSVDMSLFAYWGYTYYFNAEPSINDTTGNLTVIPISFNVIGRFDGGKYISGYASGGLTYYKADVEAESKAGYGLKYYWYEYDSDLWFLLYDSVLVPINIDDSISGAGGNVGGGVVFKIQDKVGIVADFRYYIGTKKAVSCTLEPGNYTLSINDKYDLPPYSLRLKQTDIDTFLEEYGELVKVEVNSSFFRVAFGLQFRF